MSPLESNNPTIASPSFRFIQETHHNIKDKHHLKVKGWEQIVQTNEPKMQAGVVVSMSGKLDFKQKLIRRDGGKIIHTHQRKSL